MFLGPEGRKQLKQLGDVSTIGIEMAVSIVIGFLGGGWLDEKFGTKPWFQWLGLAAGLAAAFRSLYRLAIKTRRRLAEQDSQDEDSSIDPPRGNP